MKVLIRGKEVRAQELYGVKGFYCKKCGSTATVIIENKGMIRCLGCLTLYCLGDVWEECTLKQGKYPRNSLIAVR